ncbi:glycoside hydrolase family 26 protein [Paenibacillus sp. HJGM_3]|uniref:glycoside hydrolase family 26 protein n=1 Tax=Paenibacillus sp. HJGM_3 TaxID=3379816 RepID=UPI00385A9621
MEKEAILANRWADEPARNLLRLLAGLKHRTDKKVISGQFVCPHYGRPEHGLPDVQAAWSYHIEQLQRDAGRYVGMVGFDPVDRTYLGGDATRNMPRFESFRELASQYHSQGGLIHLTWHAPNPWTSGHSWSTIPAGGALSDLITPGHAAHEQWMAWLDAMADGLEWFRQRRISLIWRPLHELNGNWFWWGHGSHEHYVSVYRHMFDYFTIRRGLNNLLWCWSPDLSVKLGSATKSRYPGNDVVDIIGFDRYADHYTESSYYEEYRNERYGKVLALTEAGQSKGSANYDTTNLLEEIRRYYPEIAFFMFWMKTETDFSIVGNGDGRKLLLNPLVCNREDIEGYST